MDKQKDEIIKSDKLAQEIRQEIYILQREVNEIKISFKLYFFKKKFKS